MGLHYYEWLLRETRQRAQNDLEISVAELFSRWLDHCYV